MYKYAIIALALVAAVPAQARTHHHYRQHHYRMPARMDDRNAWSPIAVASAATRGALVGGEASTARPGDCYGIAWCGCWLRHAFGIADRALNLARNWARVGSPASPESANVIVWPHHVGKILAYEKGRVLLQSGNDGHAVRTRWRSVAGAIAFRRV